MSSNSVGIPAGRLAQYAMLVACVPGLERRGSKAPYTSLNGNKSSFLTDTGCLALRLDADGRHAFMRDHHAKLCERYGRVMKEYVAVPERMWKERRLLRRAFVSSVAYVGALKPKVSKRKKTAIPKPPAPKAEAVEQEPATITSRTAVSRTPAKKTAGKKAVGKKTAAKKTAAKKTVTKKTVAKKAVSKAAAKATPKKSDAQKTPARTKPTSRRVALKEVGPKKAAASKRTQRRKVVAR